MRRNIDPFERERGPLQSRRVTSRKEENEEKAAFMEKRPASEVLDSKYKEYRDKYETIKGSVYTQAL